MQGPLAQITWYHNLALLEKVSTQANRLWYARQAAEHGWSQPVLVLKIEGHAHQRHGKAISNFKSTLPLMESDMAAQVFKDPYLFDFLGTADPRREREVEQALVDHIQRFLLELGTGFAFAPEFVGQMNIYLSAADDLLRHPDDKATIGLLLCKSKNKVIVEYALRNLKSPVGVAEWETAIVEELPTDLQASLPTVEEIEAELGHLHNGT